MGEFLRSESSFRISAIYWEATLMRPSIGRLRSLPNHSAPIILLVLVGSSAAFGGQIHDAAKRGDLKKVKALLKKKPGLVASKDIKYGNTPLHLAAGYGHKAVAELLLLNKADVGARDKEGWTPLHPAAHRGNREMAERLLSRGAGINARLKDGSTPLCQAADAGHEDVAELLLAKIADVNARDDSDWTPVNYAEAHGHKDVADWQRLHSGQGQWCGFLVWDYRRYRAYQGPFLLRAQVAVIHRPANAVITAVDSASTGCPVKEGHRVNYPGSIEMVPGTHSLTLRLRPGTRNTSASTPSTGEVSVVAGKEYILKEIFNVDYGANSPKLPPDWGYWQCGIVEK